MYIIYFSWHAKEKDNFWYVMFKRFATPVIVQELGMVHGPTENSVKYSKASRAAVPKLWYTKDYMMVRIRPKGGRTEN